jgi:hypothetical protein
MHADIVTLQAARELGMRYTQAAIEGAARCNHLTVVQFLQGEGCVLSVEVYGMAAARGHTDLCAYLFARLPEMVMPASCAGCASTAVLGMLSVSKGTLLKAAM